jgi:hypothetical protein
MSERTCGLRLRRRHRDTAPSTPSHLLRGCTTRTLAAAQPQTAALYLAGSVLAGLVAVWAGVLLARVLVATGAARHHRRRDQEADADGETHPRYDPDLETDTDLAPYPDPLDERSRR